MFKRIISGLLILSMFCSLGIPVLAQEEESSGIIEIGDVLKIETVEFVNSGKVVTLVNNYDSDFYLVTEEFNKKGEYIAPIIEKSITRDEFKKYYDGKAYDKLNIKAIAKNDISPLYLNVIFNKKSEIINVSYSGTVIDGGFTPVSVDGEKIYSWLLSDNEKYFSVSTNTNDKVSVYTPITDLEYEKAVFNNTHLFSKVISDTSNETETIHKEIMYNNLGKVVGTPIIIKIDNNANIAELAYVLNSLSASTISGLDTIITTVINYQDSIKAEEETVNIEKAEAPGDEIDEDAIIGTDEEDTYSIDEELISKYNGLYAEWMDTYNKGYIGIWLDPYYNGELTVIEWQDPFWSNADIVQNDVIGGVGNGYYDDANNYIEVDSSGNPIPSEPGTFDSAGNFRPENSSGYYDPNGIYHPLFEKIPGIRYEFDGSFHIDNYGYFDINGVWHAENNDNYSMVLFDGRVVYKNGFMENPITGVKIKIEKDIWGNYYYGDEVIYSDYSVYNKKENVLMLADGTKYEGKTEGGYIVFGNNDAIIKDTWEKGKKTISGVVLTNNTNITAEGIIQYPNGITYSPEVGISLPNGEILNESFLNQDYIEIEEFGRIYKNGHIATYNEFNDLITDADAVIYDTFILLDNGDVYIESLLDYHVIGTYKDAKGNIVLPTGHIISANLELGSYNIIGEFVSGLSPTENEYYDRLGNIVSYEGVVKRGDKIGYYDQFGRFVEGNIDNKGYYYTADCTKIYYEDLTVEKNEKLYGYYDKNGNFVMNDGGGFFDENGTFSQASNSVYYNMSSNGLFYENSNTRFALNIDGSIGVIGEPGTYNEKGLVTLNGDSGYYDESGVFIISKENPYIQYGYFYDSLQNKHNAGAIYKDSSGILRLLQNPQFGLSVSNDGIRIVSSDLVYDETGLVKVNNKIGYFTATGKFVESKVSPYKGGFYDENGFWIDKTYYTDIFGNLSLNYGGFNYMGNYVTPSGDIGKFNKKGEFILNESNLLQNKFYDTNGVERIISGFYIDEFNLYKNINGNEVYNVNGENILVVDSVGMKMGDYVMIEYGMFIDGEGKIGHFNNESKFILGRPRYKDGFYTPSGGFVKYGTTERASQSTNFKYILNKYYLVYDDVDSRSGTLTMSDGYSFKVKIYNDKYFELSDGTVISETGEIGYMENGVFIPGLKEITPKIIKTKENKYIDLSDEYGYFDEDGTFILYSGEYGYYNEKGTLVIDALNPYSNGFYTFEGVWNNITDFGKTANMGYFNQYGIRRNGENPYNLGFYDYEGSFHPYERDYFITSSGNVVQTGDKGIGYIDRNNNFYLYDKEGFFDADGNYYIETSLQGYYDADGILNKGKNPNFDGYYDMYGNWHLFGDMGYYDVSGYYYDDVTDSTTGYFNEVGEFTEGFNPYVNGYNDVNGNWNNTFSLPLTVYYEKDGTARVGETPYTDGYYDMYGNWHRYRDKGYFDKHGTYYSIANSSSGYYDSKGNYLEGTNPYQHGYYDEDSNLRLFEHDGYFTKEGTFIDDRGTWYFLAGGIKKRGENTNTDGFYDKYGNYYPFDEDGYYTPEGLFFPTVLIVDKYRVGSLNYVLFEGIFINTDYVPSSSKNTIQFTFNSESGAPLYVDTGIKVGRNAMVSYSQARDVLHNISIYSKSTFIEDNDSCMVIINGKIINLTNNGKMSINELRNKFLDADIMITVARTRVNQRFALVDSIEASKDIKILHNGNKYTIKNPLLVRDGVGYISLKDVLDIIVYSTKVEKDENTRSVTFTVKDNIDAGLRANLPTEISIDVGSKECMVKLSENKFAYYTLKAPLLTSTVKTTGIEEIYIPINLLGNLTGKDIQFNTLDFLIELHEKKTSGIIYVLINDN